MSGLWYNLAVRALTVAYFFVVSVLSALPVWLGYRLQKDFHRAWLVPYTLYLAGSCRSPNGIRWRRPRGRSLPSRSP
jgi:hypothetical protein